jgi:hypothetical protein
MIASIFSKPSMKSGKMLASFLGCLGIAFRSKDMTVSSASEVAIRIGTIRIAFGYDRKTLVTTLLPSLLDHVLIHVEDDMIFFSII